MATKKSINNKEYIMDTQVHDIKFYNKIIATVCKYCGTSIETYKEEDYYDRDKCITDYVYCPIQCEGAIAEYDKEQEIRKAITNISNKYADKLQVKYNENEIIVESVNEHITTLNKAHEEKIKEINKELEKSISSWNRYLYVDKK